MRWALNIADAEGGHRLFSGRIEASITCGCLARLVRKGKVKESQVSLLHGPPKGPLSRSCFLHALVRLGTDYWTVGGQSKQRERAKGKDEVPTIF